MASFRWVFSNCTFAGVLWAGPGGCLPAPGGKAGAEPGWKPGVALLACGVSAYLWPKMEIQPLFFSAEGADTEGDECQARGRQSAPLGAPDQPFALQPVARDTSPPPCRRKPTPRAGPGVLGCGQPCQKAMRRKQRRPGGCLQVAGGRQNTGRGEGESDPEGWSWGERGRPDRLGSCSIDVILYLFSSS